MSARSGLIKNDAKNAPGDGRDAPPVTAVAKKVLKPAAKKALKPVGHQVGTLKGETTWRGDWLHKPFSRLTRKPYQQTLGIHFVATAMLSLCITVISLIVGGMFGPLSGLTSPTLGLAAIQVAFVHYVMYSTLYHFRVPAFYLPHINPLMTASEMAHFQYGLIPALVQIAGQVIGHVAAAGIVLGLMKSGNPGPSLLNNSGVAANLLANTASSGWAFFLQIICSTFFSWFYFHNYNHRVREDVFQNEGDIYGPNADSRYLAQNLGWIKAACVAATFPVYGLNTGNPFHWASGCVISGQCTVSGIWGVPLGAVVGHLAGYLLHSLTWTLTGDFGKNKYE